MSKIAEYLQALDNLRDQLADNLSKMGVTASQDETLQTLVPKVLGIQQGDMRHEYCDVTLLDFPCTYGFYSYDETATMIGLLDVNGFYMIRSAEFLISGNGLSALQITAPNWTITQSDTEISLRCSVLSKTSNQFLDLVDVIQIKLKESIDLTATVTMIIVGDETGEIVGAAGSAELRFQNNSWAAIEAFGYTWGDIEANNYTWEDIETLGKPQEPT